jgi:UDP-sugar transporter A1/2/3
VACIVSGLSSSFAGVYFEKVVKTTAPSLAVRNIQLSFYGIPLAALTMVVLDVWWRGEGGAFHFFQGYSPIVWSLVAVHALGGLLVAVVVKYADNIAKGFATAVSTVLSGLYAAVFWGYVPSAEFLVGCTAVFASVIMYHKAGATGGASAGSSSTAGGSTGSTASLGGTVVPEKTAPPP